MSIHPLCLFLSLIFCITSGQAQVKGQGKNSTAKIRIKPSVQAKRIGMAVNWEPDFDAAMAKSKVTGKPIFWYVPTINGSFMDRKTEIDRYMMAGPFSWRSTVRYINLFFVPVKTVPTRAQQEKYGLVPYDFIEPGFLALKPSGEIELKVDRITTLHPQWFLDVLSKCDLESKVPPSKIVTRGHWGMFQKQQYEEILKLNHDEPELLLLKGMSLFRLGKHEEATKVWNNLSQKFPEDPLAWKAAAEAQGIGPFRRGFEVHSDLTMDYSQALPLGTTAPSGAFTEPKLWSRGIGFLLGMQNQSGAFKDSDYDFGGTDSLPNVHVAVTSLAGMALIRSLEREDIRPETRKRILIGIKHAIDYVSDDENIAKSDRDEILWAYAYRLRFLIRARAVVANISDVIPITPDALDTEIRAAVVSLEAVQSKRGSWYHEYNNPFVTATALAALKEAERSGFEVDMTKIEKGVQALTNDRMGNGAYPYSSSRSKQGRQNPGNDQNIAASAGRMPLCEMGLWYWGKSSDSALATAIERSIELQANLNMALKYDDHTSNLAYGGFFFWYDMRARSEAISLLADGQLKSKFQADHRKIILSLPEIDGCFVDSHELGRVYGTAMALLSLAACE